MHGSCNQTHNDFFFPSFSLAIHYPDGLLPCLVFRRCPSCSVHFDHTVCFPRGQLFVFFLFCFYFCFFLLFCLFLKNAHFLLWYTSWHLKPSNDCNSNLLYVLPTPSLVSLLCILLVWNPHWLYEIKSIKNIILYPSRVNVLFVIRVLYKWDATMSLCDSSPSVIDAHSFTLKRPLWKGFFDCGKITPSMSLDCKGGQCPKKKKKKKVHENHS